MQSVGKVIVSRAEFVTALKFAGRAVEKSHPNPINLCFHIEAKGKEVVIRSRRGDVFAGVGVSQVDIQRPFSCYVPAKELTRLCVDSASPTLTLASEEGFLSVLGDSTKGSLSTENVKENEEWEPMPRVDAHSVDAEWLRAACEDAYAHTSNETSRYAINGALFKRGAKRIEVVATDGRRLFVATGKAVAESSAQCVVYGDVLPIISNLCKGAKDAEWSFVRNGSSAGSFLVAATMPSGNRGWVYGKGEEGAFPPYDEVMPKNAPGFATYNSEELIGAIRAAARCTSPESPGISWWQDGDTARFLGATAERGESQSQCTPTARQNWDGLAVNPQFAIDAIKACRSHEVRIEYTSAKSPLLFIGADRKVIVMPVAGFKVPDGKPATPLPAPVAPKPKELPKVKAVAKPKAQPKPTPAPVAPPVTVQPSHTISDNARRLIDALAKIGKPADKAAMLAASGVARKDWSDALSEAYKARRIVRDRSSTDVLHCLA